MKKLALLSALLIAASLLGCSSAGSPQAEDTVSVKQLATTFSANIALLSDGRVFSWGDNQSGVLGLGDDTQKKVDEPVQVEIGEPIRQIVTSSSANMVIAIADSGKIYGWGSNRSHLLSSTDTAFFSSPVLLEFDVSVSEISFSPLLGTFTDDSGRIYGYGWNQEGSSIFLEASESLSASEHSPYEIAFQDESGLKQFESATLFRSFLSNDGKVFIQGALVEYRVNYQEITCIPFPEKIVKVGSMYQGMIALSETGKIYFLGEDRFGIHGDDSAEYYPIYEQPVWIDKLSERVRDIFVSSSSVIAVTEKGKVYTWGYNLRKNNADTLDEIVSVPNKLKYNGSIRYCYCGEFANIIINENNEVYVWGSNVQNLFLDKEKETTYQLQKLDTSVFVK